MAPVPDYRTVFDITKSSPDLSFLIVCSFLLLLGAVLTLRDRTNVLGYLCIGGVILFAVFAYTTSNSSRSRLVSALRSGRCKTVEGLVTDFHEVPLKAECFTVNATRFCYSDNFITEGFNNTRDFGGPIQPNLPVRITYFNESGLHESPGNPASWSNVIVRLEILSAAYIPDTSRRVWFITLRCAVAIALLIVLFIFWKRRRLTKRTYDL